MSNTAFGSNRGSQRKDLVTQGLVTFNCGSGKNIAEYRAKNAGSPNHFAGVTSIASTDRGAALHVKPWELMLTFKDHGSMAKGYARSHISRNMTNLRPEPFTKFGGIKKASEAEFRKTLTPLGFAADYHVYFEPSQMDLGVAAVVSGSFTTNNTGTEMWQPGALIKWSPPPMDPTESVAIDSKTREFVEKRRKVGAVSPSEPADIFPAVLSPFDFDTEVVNGFKAKIAAALAEVPTTTNMRSSTASDNIQFLVRQFKADVLTYLRMMAALNANTTTAAAIDDDDHMAKKVLQYFYAEETDLSTVANRTAAQNSVNSFHNQATIIHEAMQKVVCKSIGFSLPGAGGDVVV